MRFTLLALFLCVIGFFNFAQAFLEHRIEYDDVQEWNSVEDISNYYKDGKGPKNSIIYVYSDDSCKEGHQNPLFRGAYRNAGPEFLQLAAVSEQTLKEYDPSIHLPSNCSHILFVPLGGTPSEYARAPSQANNVLNHWYRDQTRSDVSFRNNYNVPIDIYWEDEGKGQKKTITLQPGQTSGLQSFISHIFIAKEADTERLLDAAAVPGRGLIEFPTGILKHDCESDEHEESKTCDNLETQLIKYTHAIQYSKRLGLNYLQPKLVPAITKEGFLKTRLPQAAWDRLRNWYHTHEQIEKMETSVGPCLNQLDSPTYIRHLPRIEKDALSKYVQPMLEKWSGKELAVTSIYGIRRYTEGAILRMHADTVSTHVVSAIVNVDNEVNEPWLLEIMDHDGNLHHVEMEAGDMVYYESARLLHGRPQPFNGTYYANIFIHYAPKDGSWQFDWV